MAQQWYESLRAALGAALRGDAAAAGRVRAELQARPVLGPFAVHELRGVLGGGGSGAGAAERCGTDAAHVLQVVCRAALESRKTMEALLASMRADVGAAPLGGEGALWSAMAQVDWDVKLVVAAHFVARLGAPGSGRDSIDGGGAESSARVLELVTQMVASALSAAAAESALMQDAGGTADSRRGVMGDLDPSQVSAAAAALSENAGLLNLSATTRAVLQALHARMDGKSAGDNDRAVPRSRDWYSIVRSSSVALSEQDEAIVLRHDRFARPHHEDERAACAEGPGLPEWHRIVHASLGLQTVQSPSKSSLHVHSPSKAVAHTLPVPTAAAREGGVRLSRLLVGICRSAVPGGIKGSSARGGGGGGRASGWRVGGGCEEVCVVWRCRVFVCVSRCVCHHGSGDAALHIASGAASFISSCSSSLGPAAALPLSLSQALSFVTV